MMGGWIITEDRIEDGREVGTMGPFGITLTGDEVKAKGVRFRMLDDDGEVYYIGKAVLAGDDDGFGPLDNFGMPNAGCTRIDYWEKGWKTL